MERSIDIDSETASLLVQVEGAIHRMEMGRIIHLASSGAYTLIERQGHSEPLHVGKNLGKFEKALAPFGFQRIHKGHLVNLKQVECFSPASTGGGVVRLSDGTELPVSRSQKALFLLSYKKLAAASV